MDMTPTGLFGNQHLAEIRGLILLDQWRAEGLSESQIQERFLKDGVLGAFGSGPDVNAIVHQIRNEGLGLDDALKLATLGAFSKFTDKTSGAANKGTNSTLQQKSKVEMDSLASQYNNKNLHPKDFTISVNGKTLTTDKNASVGAPVFKGASDSDVMAYFKQLAGIDAMPTAKIIPGKGTVYSVKVTEGLNAGSSVTLRDFSNSTSQTNAKWTIDIQNMNINKGNRVEVKFQ